MSGVAVAPDGTWLATRSDRTVRICDTATGQERATLTVHDADSLRPIAIAVAPDGSWLASSGKTVQIWDTTTGRVRFSHDRNFRIGQIDAGSIAIAPDCTWLAATVNGSLVRIWDVATGQKNAPRSPATPGS
jgi:WD40 repeat protein